MRAAAAKLANRRGPTVEGGSTAACAASLLLVALVAGCLCVQPASALPSKPPFTDADYWQFADRTARALDAWWRADRRAYVMPGAHVASIRANADMLAVHAIAAFDGQAGPSRQDERARQLVERLLAPPTWRGPTRARITEWAICWSSSLDSREPGLAPMEPKVAQALAYAWRARRALALSQPVVDRLVMAVDYCARHPHWRFPFAVANQINWNADLYAAAATVTGRGDLLRGLYRRYLGWFTDAITRPASGRRTSNLGPGYEFRYLPSLSPSDPYNFDSPEYANVTVQFVEHYDDALGYGMRPLSARAVRLLRAWVRRLLTGSWTHAGFLNWDTGQGMRRLYSAQYWALAQQGLLAIASSPPFRSRLEGRWAKALFDRALLLYRRFADEAGGPLPPGRLFGIRSEKEHYASFVTRMALNAARAVDLGLGARPAQDPPPLYAYDYDTGRVAVTTPRYSTAIVPDNRGAFEYGGIEIARLVGAGQRVAANLGGLPPAAFGALLEDRHGRTLLASQHVRARPVRVLRSPRGAIRRLRAYPARPYAGPFRVLEVRGTVRRRGARVTSTYRFTRNMISGRWVLSCPSARCGRARVLFPTAGALATIDALLNDGRHVRVAGPDARIRIDDVARVRAGPGYSILVRKRPRTATLRAIPATPQSTNPDPGPTLAVELPPPNRSRAVVFEAVLVPGS